jgi:hypothetical protein
MAVIAGMEGVTGVMSHNELRVHEAIKRAWLWLPSLPKTKPSRFDAPGKKWKPYFAMGDPSFRPECDDGKNTEHLFDKGADGVFRCKSCHVREGELHAKQPDGSVCHSLTMSMTRLGKLTYVHPRSLKGRVNVAACQVDDPCGDDVAEG